MKPPTAKRVLTLMVIAGLISVALVTAWKWGVLPVRNWMHQRDEIARLELELGELQASNAALREEVRLLQTDSEIELIARRDFGLVYPGEEAYAILPQPVATPGG